MENKNLIGKIGWVDLTVDNAEEIKNFYSDVIGWQSSPHNMGDYHDFDISSEDGEVITGICHARGSNKNIPPQWVIYINVASVIDSTNKCLANGGEIIDGPRLMGDQQFCLLRDPVGAIFAIMEEA